MTLDEFVSQLEGVRRTGRGVMARCPSHDDTSPSLSIREGDYGLLVHDFGGCPVEEIVRAMGLRMTDLFYDNAPSNHHEWKRRNRERDEKRVQLAHANHLTGLSIDCQREADALIASARN